MSRNKDIDGNRRKTRKGWVTGQIRRQRKGTERMGIAKRQTERGREQAGMSREGRRTMEKVLENTVRDISQLFLWQVDIHGICYVPSDRLIWCFI